MPVFNYSDRANELRDIICSNPIAELAARRGISNAVTTFPSIRYNPDYAMNVASVRNTLESMAPNAVLGDLAVLHERQFRPRSRESAAISHPDVLRKLEEDYRKWEVERIKRLISSKATIRYSIEVK
jgi:hypothetical protein